VWTCVFHAQLYLLVSVVTSEGDKLGHEAAIFA
jgi:hypothetical protein